jgi:N-methylhydantoinase B
VNPYIAASTVHRLIELSLSELPSAALLDSESQPLFIKYQNLTDVGTYPLAASICDQYMNVQDGDVILLNDPYSGGSILSTMTLIMGIETEKGAKKNDSPKLLLGTRVTFKPRLTSQANVEKEGIRIPPTPIYQNGQINADFFSIIENHPLKPVDFQSMMVQKIEEMKTVRKKLQASLEACGLKLNKKQIVDYHKICEERARKFVGDISIGEAYTEITLGEATEKLCLKVEVQDNKVIFDFTRSTASKTLALTDSAAVGACAGALYSCLNQVVPMNAGALRAIEVMTPKGTLVHAKYPAPVFLGLTDGVALVASTVVDLIGKIDPRKKMAQSGFSQVSVDIDFGQDHHYFEWLESGVAASTERSGVPGFDLWKRSHLVPSIEAAEERLPIRILSTGYRQKSGGSGQNMGGDGVTRAIETLVASQLSWAMAPPRTKPEGLAGGKAASPPEIYVVLPGQTKKKLEPMGSMALPAHSQVIMNSAGGGGYGENIEDPLS